MILKQSLRYLILDKALNTLFNQIHTNFIKIHDSKIKVGDKVTFNRKIFNVGEIDSNIILTVVDIGTTIECRWYGNDGFYHYGDFNLKELIKCQ